MSEVLAPEAFIQDLVARIEARRTFGNHPLWLAIADGKLSGEQLKLFAIQFFLQVREFPRAVSAMHSNCPFPKLRQSNWGPAQGKVAEADHAAARGPAGGFFGGGGGAARTHDHRAVRGDRYGLARDSAGQEA